MCTTQGPPQSREKTLRLLMRRWRGVQILSTASRVWSTGSGLRVSEVLPTRVIGVPGTTICSVHRVTHGTGRKMGCLLWQKVGDTREECRGLFALRASFAACFSHPNGGQVTAAKLTISSESQSPISRVNELIGFLRSGPHSSPSQLPGRQAGWVSSARAPSMIRGDVPRTS